MLIFLHISKTGGSTLIPVLDWNYEQQIHKISLHSKVPEFIDLADSEKMKFQALAGMVFYGIHQYIPQDCQYISILRHPVKRLVSHYHYLNVRKQKLGEEQSDISIEEFLEIEPFQAYTQLNLIAGGDSLDEALKRPLPEDALERAKSNVEKHFPVLGLVEHYDESLMMMKNHFGWGRAFYTRVNVNQGRKTFADFPAETQRFIEGACEPELEFFEYAQKRLQSQLDVQDEQFWRDVQQLKKRNHRFSQLHQLAEPIRNTKLWDAAKWVLRNLQGK